MGGCAKYTKQLLDCQTNLACSVRREHDVDRQREQRPESFDDLVAGDGPAQPLVQREARSEVDERVANDDHADTVDPQDEVVVLAARVRLDPAGQPVAVRVPVGVTEAAPKPMRVRAAVTRLLEGDAVPVDQVLRGVERRRPNTRTFAQGMREC